MSQDGPRRGQDVYIALAAVGWADGSLDPDEADAIVRAALEEGLDLDAIAEIEAATQAPVDLGPIEQKRLTEEDRAFVYAVAGWLANLDGTVTAGETAALTRLGDALRVPDAARAPALAAAREVAAMPEGDRPDRYDLAALRWLIGEQLRAAAASADEDDED
jgi:uncharacterized membrane protein YebE (DUF533 family)